jgi:hypothetical protein
MRPTTNQADDISGRRHNKSKRKLIVFMKVEKLGLHNAIGLMTVMRDDVRACAPAVL